MNEKLKIKDLVTIGIFAVIYFALSFLVAMLGLVPILIFIIPIIMALLSGTIVMLFMAKVPRPWALFIFGMITPLFMWAMGHTYIVPLTAVLFVAIAEIIFRKGKFKSLKYNSIAYAVFSCWMAGSLLQIIILTEKYIALQVGAGMSEQSINSIVSFITWPNLIIIVALTFLAGLLGAFIGKKMLRKHFEKVGII